MSGEADATTTTTPTDPTKTYSISDRAENLEEIEKR